MPATVVGMAAPTPTGSATRVSLLAFAACRGLFLRCEGWVVTDIPRPYAHMQADELADEITVCRECIQTTRDLRLRKQMQAKLAELIAEENRRFTEGLPF